MTSILRRSSAVALLLVTLAACDSGVPDGTSPVVGTWVSDANIQTILLTSDRRQTLVDNSQPGSGTLAFSGAADGTLRYASVYTTREGQTEATVFSIDSNTHPFPDAYAFLSLDRYQTTLTVWRGGVARQFSQPHPDGAGAFTIADGQLTVRPLTLTLGSERVSVGGALALPTLTLEAGVETAVDRQTSAQGVGRERRRTFEADGTYREAYADTSAPGPFTGTWEDLGDQVRLRVVDLTADLDYRLADGRLFLSTTDDTCTGPNPECRVNYERQFNLAAQSVTRVRLDRTERLVPARR